MELIREAYKGERRVRVDTFSGLLVDYAERVGASVIVRGLRAISDFEYEFQMALMNRRLDPHIETVFMAPAEGYSYVSSRLVKEVFQLGGARERAGAACWWSVGCRRSTAPPARRREGTPLSATAADGSANDLSRRALSLEISATVAVAQRAAALRAEGRDGPRLQRGRAGPAHAAPRLGRRHARRWRTGARATPPAAGIPRAARRRSRSATGRTTRSASPIPRWPSPAGASRRSTWPARRCSTAATRSSSRRRTGRRSARRCGWPARGPILVHTQEKDGFKVTARTISKATGPRTKAVHPQHAQQPDRRRDRPRRPARHRRHGPAPQVHDPLRRHLRAHAVRQGGPAARCSDLKDAVGGPLRGAGHRLQELLHDRLAHRLGAGPEDARRRLRGARLAQHAVPDRLRPVRRGGGADRARRSTCRTC